MDLELHGKTALITGASTGIGRGIALALAAEGVRIAVVARRAELLDDLARQIEGRGGKAIALPADVTALETIPPVVAEAARRLGPIDILVNSAGGSKPAPLGTSDGDWARSMNLSFHAGRKFAEHCLPQMIERRWGRVITVTGAFEPRHLNADQAAKAATQSWMKGLSLEVAGDGVTVNSIAPGRILSEQIERMYPTVEAREAFARENVPIGYFGEPTDVGYAACFLASPKARYITGAILYVDGGYHRFAF